MLLLFDRCAAMTSWSENFAALEPVSVVCWIGGPSLVGVGVVWQLSLVCLLTRIMISFLCYYGYLNLIQIYKSRFITNSSSCAATELFKV